MAMAGCSVLSPTFLDCSNLNLASVPNYINFGKYEMVSFQGNSIIHGDVSNFPFSKFDFRNQRVEFNCDLIKYADSQIIFPCQPNGKRDRDDEQKEEEERKKKERKKREREDEDRDSKRRRRLWVKVIIPWVFVSVMVVSLAGVIAYKVAQYVKKNRQRGRHHFYGKHWALFTKMSPKKILKNIQYKMYLLELPPSLPESNIGPPSFALKNSNAPKIFLFRPPCFHPMYLKLYAPLL